MTALSPMPAKGAPCLTIAALNKLRPCAGDGRRVRAPLRKLSGDKGHCFTAADAVAAGCTLSDLVWAASYISIDDKAVEHKLRLWRADCAAHVLHIFEADCPDDDRPRKAIQASRDFANGRISDAARAAASAAEEQWQLTRLLLWLSADEPKPLRLPARPTAQRKAA